MRRGSTQFWHSASAGILAFGLAALLTIPAGTGTASEARRENELTLAGLRPGRDTLEAARRKLGVRAGDGTAVRALSIDCGARHLSMDANEAGVIQTIRVSAITASSGEGCPQPAGQANGHWTTGRGIGPGSACAAVLRMYGPPDSRGPSTQAGKRLELLYYAFDWAGPDVPQVMEVLCTPEKGTKQGRVVEVMLAAPSL